MYQYLNNTSCSCGGIHLRPDLLVISVLVSMDDNRSWWGNSIHNGIWHRIYLSEWKLIQLLCCTGVGHSRGAVQCNSVRASARWEHGWNLLHWQRGSVWHLFPHSEADHTDLRWPQPSRLCHYVGRHYMPPLPRPGRNLLLHVFLRICLSGIAYTCFCAFATVRMVLEALCFGAVCVCVCPWYMLKVNAISYKLLVGISPNLQVRCILAQGKLIKVRPRT